MRIWTGPREIERLDKRPSLLNRDEAQFRGWCLALAAAFCAIQVSPAMAERDKRSGAPLRKTREIASPITDRFYVRGTFYDAQVSTNLRVDGARGTLPGTSVSAERDLGMASRLTQGRVELMFRLRERNRAVQRGCPRRQCSACSRAWLKA